MHDVVLEGLKLVLLCGLPAVCLLFVLEYIDFPENDALVTFCLFAFILVIIIAVYDSFVLWILVLICAAIPIVHVMDHFDQERQRQRNEEEAEREHQETLTEKWRQKEQAEADVARAKAAMLAAEHRAAERERLVAEHPASFAEQVLREQIHKLYAQRKEADADGRELDARRLDLDIKALERANEIIKKASEESEA